MHMIFLTGNANIEIIQSTFLKGRVKSHTQSADPHQVSRAI